MKVSLGSSLHLDHGRMSTSARAGAPLPLQSFVPVGLLYLKAFARDVCDVTVHELNGILATGVPPNNDRLFEELARLVAADAPDIVGLMTDADSLHHTIALADAVRRLTPEARICLGGPAATPIAPKLLERFRSLDFVVRGEGEVAFRQLVLAVQEGASLGGVPSLTWRDGGSVRSNPDAPLLTDLDELPPLDYADYRGDPGAPLYVDVGRGCPFPCRFCATAPFWRRKYRMKRTERILDELELLKRNYGRTRVNFSHDIFTADQEWVASFCEALAARDLGIEWTCSTRTDVIDDRLLGAMAASGCREIYYGIESGSTEIQRTIDKNLDLDRARHIVQCTARHGIRPVTGFIVGYPFETEDTLDATLRAFFEFLNVGGYRAHVFTLSPYHQSALYADHASSVTERAQYFDLPLAATNKARIDALIERNADVFANSFRFKSAALDPMYVAAAEEISSVLSQLRLLWRPLIPLYRSPLEWYSRWVRWIGEHNASAGVSLTYCGDAGQMLDFVESEVVRLGRMGTELADLVTYERVKLAARRLPTCADRTFGPADATREDRLVAMPLLKRRIHHDLTSVLGETIDGSARVERSDLWVAATRVSPQEVRTLQIGPASSTLLDRCETAGVEGLPVDGFDGQDADVARMLVEVGLAYVRRPNNPAG